jgi:membrane-bound lytic murein transglycosylase D
MKFTLHLNHLLLGSILLLPSTFATAQSTANVLDLKNSITDSNIVYPESFEADTQKMREGWYLKNYTATDDRYRRQPDVPADDATIKARLAKLPTVIEMPFNQIVRQYIERYTSRGREQVSTLLGLSIYYMPIFEQALEENGLPLELKYLPVIESALNPNAVSRHGAAGLWQFMLATANGMGMEVSSLVDERRDPYVSSQAAAKLLKELHAAYGDWSLAIAAYNCGAGTVNKAIRRAGGEPSSHDFWSIYNYLPEETRGYVPMFIAANYVMNYYPQHNISPVLPTKPLVTDTLMISTRVHFEQISNVLDIPVDELRILNPQFRADIIPGSADKPYTLILPSQQCHAYIMSEDDILAYEAEKYAQRTEVNPGDMPGEHAVTSNELPDDTPLEAPAVQSNPVASSSKAKNTQTAAATSTATGGKTITHKVEAGESLSDIAAKYNVTPEQIKEWNGLRRNAVRTGQQLRITTTPALAAANGGKEVAQNTTPRKQQWSDESSTKQSSKTTSSNKSSTTSSSRKENKKKINAEPKAPTSHTVKSGENLSVIAKKYGVTVDELRKSSGIKGDEIHPGDKISLPKKAKGSSNSSSSSSKKSSKSKKKRR